MEGVAIAQEVIHQCKKANLNDYILKLDFKKAYDMVNEEYLLDVLTWKVYHRGFYWKSLDIAGED